MLEAIALAHSVCRVRSLVGQDFSLVVRRFLDDTMGIVSDDRTEASLCHRLAAFPFIASTRLHLALLIRHLEFVLGHLAFVIRHLPLVIYHPASVIRHLAFAIRRPASVLRHLAFAIRHLAFAIWHLPSAISPSPSPIPNPAFRILQSVSSVRSSSRVLADWYRRCRSNAGLQSSAARSAQWADRAALDCSPAFE